MDQSKHGEGVTSVKVHQPSGGAQTFNVFGNDPDADKDRFAPKAGAAVPVPKADEEEKKDDVAAGTKKPASTSVKVAAPPGGKSSITFG
jgi:hypothetical protein